ncbi:MAG: CBS domain-containing protein [Alphaproteobacteria bacterium]|nr:CBS domain-containing protein [Alphaproteobacteria bacterium]
MQVADILKEKGERVVTTREATAVTEVAEILRDEQIGAVLVNTDEGAIAGIISERDIVRSIADRGAQTLDLSVADLMTRSVVTCTPETDTEELMNQMLSGHLRHLPVLEDGALVGLVSINDVVKNVLSELTWIRGALEDQVAKSAAWATDED